jgi:hypothetical protein
VRKNILAGQLQISKGSKWRSNKELFTATDDGWNINEKSVSGLAARGTEKPKRTE